MWMGMTGRARGAMVFHGSTVLVPTLMNETKRDTKNNTGYEHVHFPLSS